MLLPPRQQPQGCCRRLPPPNGVRASCPAPRAAALRWGLARRSCPRSAAGPRGQRGAPPAGPPRTHAARGPRGWQRRRRRAAWRVYVHRRGGAVQGDGGQTNAAPRWQQRQVWKLRGGAANRQRAHSNASSCAPVRPHSWQGLAPMCSVRNSSARRSGALRRTTVAGHGASGRSTNKGGVRMLMDATCPGQQEAAASLTSVRQLQAHHALRQLDVAVSALQVRWPLAA